MTDRREELERHIVWLTAAIDEAKSGNELAALVRERRLTVDALAAVPVSEEVSVADDLARKREARIAGSDDSARAPRRSQSRRRGGSNRTG